MLQSPPPYVPVVEYVLKALEHPPFMYVAKLAACCIMLFLTRENPELLQELSRKWALRFQQDRAKLVGYIRKRASYCVISPDASVEMEMSDKVNSDEVDDITDGESSSKDTQRNDDNEEEPLCGIRSFDPDTAVEHLLSILNTLVPMYFSWNWHRADYVVQINREYEVYVREFILPMCAALAPENGVDDEEHTPWLLTPHTYLDSTQNITGFYTPTSGTGQFPPVKEGSVAGSRLGVAQNSEGGSSVAKSTGMATPLSGGLSKASSELEGLGYSTIHKHFANSPMGRKSADRHAGAVATQLPRFALARPTSRGEYSKDVLGKSASQVPAAVATTPTGRSAAMTPNAMQPASVPRMSPNVMSAGVFNAAAVYGLRFLSLNTYRAALRRNTRGLVTVFHAKYSARSNEVIDAFQMIMAKRLLNPMPTIAVVYAVAEPELSTLYKVSWFPTIVYTPPLSCQQQHKRSIKGDSSSQTQPNSEGGRTQPSAAGKFHLKPCHRQHPRSHSHHRQRRSTKSGGTRTLSPATSSRQLSGSESLPDLTLNAAGATVSPATGSDAAEYEEEDRIKWESPGGDAGAAAASGSNAEITSTIAAAVAAADAATLVRATEVSAATPTHHNLFMECQPDSSTVPFVAGPSGPLTATAPAAPTPSELLFGIGVGDTTPVLPSKSPSRHHDPITGSVENFSLPSSVDDGALPLTQLPLTKHRPRPQRPLLDIVQRDYHVIYPLLGDLTVPALVEWIGSRGASVPRLSKLKDISTCLKSIRKEEKFKRYRELHSAVVTLRRLQGQGPGEGDLFGNGGGGGGAGSSPASRKKAAKGDGKPGQQPQQAAEQPLFIFLGGGMAAGKTTAVAALAKSSWWQNHKEQSVLVNADEFKLPLECELASAEAHRHSTRAAENLLVKAVNQGRSIVLDGTMMWKPFVQQVVHMIRAAHLTLFKQGPGCDPKTKVEQYFLADKKRQPVLPFPYKIILLGITVDVEIAVPRGFLRKFSSNRGVPISMQLRSFKMFSENFADYVAMMDETTLYNNNVYVNLEKGELPPVMAECTEETGHKLLIHDEAAFQHFIKQQLINENADNVMQVYPSSPVTAEFPR
ncbi:hypothetical protein ABB37_03349 [Leptomonas pyrrhocoris]|uniref:Zeta toxin domain-containing protein n=1 Tax=Leptomonas pyrrhocoris TaxID=157538 RepID=A0A0M9G4Q9_LEPPY|nr:hypothetical protein ABB37_03349 [Leptomonas pyrrhocoris]KPA82233.1 hypothetical protein ABB37_03349 [Leptomonas pyrrhocoris]|eukprot:XP_015660672.1 hypothetical protein ABB37_03349 [Leptomonas pyrrhocoris]